MQNGGFQHQSNHTARNPMAQVPSLELADGTIINQSLAIIQWLEYQQPTPSLLGTSAREKTRIWELSEMINAGTQPLQNLSVLQYVVRHFNADKLEWGRHFITIGLDAFQQRVQQTAGRFCVGDQLSAADLCLIPQLYNARRFSCDMSQWSTLCEIENNCTPLSAFQKAHPDQQPDATP